MCILSAKKEEPDFNIIFKKSQMLTIQKFIFYLGIYLNYTLTYNIRCKILTADIYSYLKSLYEEIWKKYT